MTVLFCLQVCPLDCDAAIELVELITNIRIEDHSTEWLIVYRQDTPVDRVMRMQIALAKKFPKASSHRAPRYAQGWPAGSNALWFSAMEYAAALKVRDFTKCEGILTFEPDCVPARKDWIEVLNEAYENRESPIVGNLHQSEIPEHINGNAIWPIDLLTDYPDLVKCPMTVAWDFFHRELFVPMAEDTPFITQYYHRRNLTAEEFLGLQKHDERPALLHGVKDFSARLQARSFLTDKKSLVPMGLRVLKTIS